MAQPAARRYEDQLYGRPGNHTLELDRATIADEDWQKGPAHVNAIIAAQIEEYARRQTPIAREIEIDRASGNIVAREPRERQAEPDEPSADRMAARHKSRIARGMERLRGEEDNAPFQMIRRALNGLEEVLDAPFDPEDWCDEIEGVALEIEILKRNGDLPLRAPELERFRETLDRAAHDLKDRYPRLALADEGRRAQRLRRLDDAEVRALEASLEAFENIVDAQLREMLGEDVHAARLERSTTRTTAPTRCQFPRASSRSGFIGCAAPSYAFGSWRGLRRKGWVRSSTWVPRRPRRSPSTRRPPRHSTSFGNHCAIGW